MIDNLIDSKNDLAAVNIALPSDAVRVMTIHKSKGLEFPYVFILNVNKKFNTKDLSSDLILSRKNGAVGAEGGLIAGIAAVPGTGFTAAKPGVPAHPAVETVFPGQAHLDLPAHAGH